MHGHNLLLNQPLAIERDYLFSLIPAVLLGFKSQTLKSSAKIDEDFSVQIKEQIKSRLTEGASQFPVVVNIIGPIVKYSDWNYVGTQTYMRILSQLERDPEISGIVLNIDSGGGMVSGTAEFADFISKLQKPTVSYTNDYQCSAAQWIASACQYKMAGPHASAIGSIGTLMSYLDLVGMYEKWGAKFYEIYAPQSTDKNSEFRSLVNGDEKPYSKRLEQITETFISHIKANYGDGLTDDGHVFKGKTYTAQEALEIGLVQEIGTLNDALSKF